MRRAAPGQQVSAGRLRVDAARAIKKLREYQLVDRAAWVLEAIRAAVAAGASKIELRGDSNDIWIGWHGTPWDAEVLPRLFDELVSPEVADNKQPVRLLAAAVNSALGMDPAYVDVYSITAAGQAQRARYTPEVLAEPENELGEAALRHVAVEAHEPPTTIMSGVLVHLRRRISMSVLSYWIGEPPELPLARQNCQNIAVPLEINGDVTLSRELAAKRDLVRVPLDEGLSGFVAITSDAVPVDAVFEVAERGVVLARYELPILGYAATIPIPVRVFLDADRLPTNASRSQVRRDVHPIATAERRATQVIGEAIKRLAALVEQPAEGDVYTRARATVFRLLASSVGGHPSGWPHIPPLLAPLGDVPLVKTALGEPRPIRGDWTTHIHSERTALDPDLAPWLGGDILWAPPGDAVRILLHDITIDVARMRRHARAARKQRVAHQKFLAHAKRELVVQTSVYPRARVALGVEVANSCVQQDVFAGMTGEICVYSEGRNGALVLCVDGRELERIEMASEIAFDAIIDHPKLVPTERYRGVQRDNTYALVDLALKAGVIRAVETLAVESKHMIDSDRALIGSALVLAKELQRPITGPLTEVSLWRTTGGSYVSFKTIDNTGYVGVIAETETLPLVPGRTIVHATGPARDVLKRLLDVYLVPYHRAVTGMRRDVHEMANALPRKAGAVALIVERAGMRGVITPSAAPTMLLHHCGIPIGDTFYKPVRVRCAIAVDADAIAPNERWKGFVFDGGIREQSFESWELELLRAIAAALLGTPPPSLITSGAVSFADASGEALVTALSEHNPVDILGTELFERLCSAPLFQCIGRPERVSIVDLAAKNVHGIFYVESLVAAVDDFTPVVATERVANLVGKLGRRPMHSGVPELKRREKVAQHRRRLAEHLTKPVVATTFDDGIPHVSFIGKVVRGVIGVTANQPGVSVHVESRLFDVIHPAVGFPVTAAIDLPVAQVNATFETIPHLIFEQIIEDLRDAVPALIESIARSQPRLLGEPGPARRLLAKFLSTGSIDAELRALLCAVPAFATVQGEYCSIDSIDSDMLPVAAYGDDWLEPGDGERPTPYEVGVLRVTRPVDELSDVLGKLHADGMNDVTSEVSRLQARRRMARGLLPTPKLSGIPDVLKRPLSALGDAAKKLGHGEIGFSTTWVSTLHIHEQGVLQRSMDIDVMPAIQIAMETPHDVLDHPSMVRLAQDLAVELVNVALPADPSVVLRRNLGRAVLARRLPPATVATKATPLFQRIDGSWIGWSTFNTQLATYHDVWAVTQPQLHEPLDPNRIVLMLPAADIETAAANGFPVINATVELGLDATTRANQARAKAVELELPVIAHELLGQVELPGNGVTGPRGIVGVLAPGSAHQRGVHPHFGMHPLDRTGDVCKWPTVTVLDDERISPDRTWSMPKDDETWQAIARIVRTASETAIGAFGAAPSMAHVELRITNHVCADVRALRDAPRSQIRGLLWLSHVPYTPMVVNYLSAKGRQQFTPAFGLALGGQIAIHSDEHLNYEAALEQLCGIAHGKLVRALSKDTEVDPDIVAAHVAHALALQTVKPTEVNAIKFTCFVPAALEPRSLASLFLRKDPVSIVRAGTTDIGETAFVDDGSQLAKVVRAHLGERLTTTPPRAKVQPAAPLPKPPVSVARPAATSTTPVAVKAQPAAPAPKPKPAPPHALAPLVTALRDRLAELGIQTHAWAIEDVKEPMVDYRDLQIVIAGDNPRLRRLRTELAADDSALAAPAIDAVAAHIVSLMNIARSDITDGAEMHALGVLLADR